MSLRRFLLIAAASILVPVGSALALNEVQFNSPEIVAQRSSRTDEARSAGSWEARWIEELDLSADQSESIQAIREESRETMAPLREQLQQAREQLRSQMASDTSANQLRQQHGQVQALQQALGEQRFESMLAIREVLTPEQRTRMAELVEQHWGQRGRGDRSGGRFGGERN